MKYLILFLLPLISYAEFETHSSFEGYKTGVMINQTRDAILSYDFVQEKTEYWGNRLEKILLNDYSEKIILISPLITGKFEVSAMDLNFYVDTRREKGGVRYTYKF